MKIFIDGDRTAGLRYFGLARSGLIKLKKMRKDAGLNFSRDFIHIGSRIKIRMESSAFGGEKAWISTGGFLFYVDGSLEDAGLPISNYFTIIGTQSFDELPDEWFTQETIPIPEIDGRLEGKQSGNTEDFEGYVSDDIISELEVLTENDLTSRITTLLQGNRVFVVNRTSVFVESVGGVHGLSYEITHAITESNIAISSVTLDDTGTSGLYTIFDITISFSEPRDGHLWNGLPTTRAAYIPEIVGDGPNGSWMEPTAPNQLIRGDGNSQISVVDLELELGVVTFVDTTTVFGYPDGDKDVDRYIRLDSQSERADGQPGFNKGFSIILRNVHVQSFFNIIPEESDTSIVWETWDEANDPPVSLPEEILNSGFNPDYEEPWITYELVTTSASGGSNAAEMKAIVNTAPEEGGGGR